MVVKFSGGDYTAEKDLFKFRAHDTSFPPEIIAITKFNRHS